MRIIAALVFASSQIASFPLTTTEHLTLHGVKADVVTHRGSQAVRLMEEPDAEGDNIAVLPGSFGDGTIEVEIASAPRAGANEGARGFAGIAFRVQPDQRFECFYIRPTNGRADDQLRRNHSTQYISHPDYPWHRLRRETPGVYESYVDLVPGEWTKLKIVVRGTRAELYVHGADQPALIVKDLKHGDSRGAVALWIGAGTEAHFRNLKWTTN